MRIVLSILDIILALSGIVFAILEWSGIFHTTYIPVGFLWIVLACAALDRISRRNL